MSVRSLNSPAGLNDLGGDLRGGDVEMVVLLEKYILLIHLHIEDMVDMWVLESLYSLVNGFFLFLSSHLNDLLV